MDKNISEKTNIRRRTPARMFLLLLICLDLPACVSSPALSAGGTVGDIPSPPGYVREVHSDDGFAAWLQQLPLKTNNVILLYTGKSNRSHRFNVLAVIEKPLLFRENLEECVDFCLRIWADYHYESGLLDRLYLFDRDGGKVYFSATALAAAALKTGNIATAYREFLKQGMAWTNPHSIAQGSSRLADCELRPGDLVLQTSSRYRGQASMILDDCIDQNGGRLFLIGFGFSPAQEFHIERAPVGFGTDGWFSLDGYFRFLELNCSDFGNPVLIRL